MGADFCYRLAADAVLVSHALFVAFVVLGLVAIYVGRLRSWAWVRNFWFRLAHLGAIGTVALESWTGVLCPLTAWEMRLRELAGGAAYEGTFIQHWLQTVLYHEAPEWVFGVAYTVFAVLVFASWFIVPPGTRGPTGSTGKAQQM